MHLATAIATEPIADPFVSTNGETRVMKVTREAVARVLARAVGDASLKGRSLAVSGY